VEANKPGSHANRGWEIFTDKIVSTLNHLPRPIVFMLWGNYAKSKGIKINREKHFILESPHPSPFSAHSGFIGNQHFKKCNEFLTKSNRSPINWSDAGPTIK
jgi:uracil-DNA glycosylase